MPRTPSSRRRGDSLRNFLPWLIAPAWVFLPVSGCGLARTMLRAGPMAGSPVVPIAPVMPIEPRLASIAAPAETGLRDGLRHTGPSAH